MGKLDLTNLQKAVASLRRNLLFSEQFEKGSDNFASARDGVIQSFEYTFELSWLMMKRALKAFFQIDTRTFPRRQIYKKAFEKELIKNEALWEKFNDARDVSSHEYGQDRADEVYDTAREFLGEAASLLAILERSND